MTARTPDSIRVPDLVEALVGWRVWRVESSDLWGMSLRSLYHDVEWRPDHPVRATCSTPLVRAEGDPPVLRPHPTSPDEDCKCGLHASKAADLAARYMPRHLMLGPTLFTKATNLVIGRVKLTGKVIEHEWGFRAELARVGDVLVPHVFRLRDRPIFAEEARDALSSLYAVPAHIVRDLYTLTGQDASL